jgi:hypothetical protein
MGTNHSTPTEETCEAEENLLNSYNLTQHQVPRTSDVVVVGAGIHSLIYAIHLKTKEIQDSNTGKLQPWFKSVGD